MGYSSSSELESVNEMLQISLCRDDVQQFKKNKNTTVPLQ